MKIALVGIGKIARDQHVPAIADSPDWELAATCSNHGTVEGIEAHKDFGAMLAARPDIQVISLCLPPVPRFAYAAQAIAAGRHVMLEKPPGATLSECHALEEMARAKGVTLYASWHSRAAAQVQAAKAWLKDKTLRSLNVTWKEDVRRWHPGQDWIFEAGGLGVFDPGINALSIMTEILPDPIHVTGAELDFPENRETPIAARVAFFHPKGAEVTMDMDFLQTGEQIWSMEAVTDQGTLSLHKGGAVLENDGKDVADASGVNLSLKGEYPVLYAHMAELVRAGRSDVDLAPMRHVADAFTLGRRLTVAPFDW
ncbi:Gfo/Idh/MocA family protein [Acidimangrovimonas sediminis]|uniref:Gfo/Idh/MocA family protein n=1 Tax=Acidimangrovimonas sediminis TaxID=2056283 RepID=UPI000C80191B|nr:Gfo/Idh/MocA family oxidoreductase [Acidimangrovimonas sediminis]